MNGFLFEIYAHFRLMNAEMWNTFCGSLWWTPFHIDSLPVLMNSILLTSHRRRWDESVWTNSDSIDLGDDMDHYFWNKLCVRLRSRKSEEEPDERKSAFKIICSFSPETHLNDKIYLARVKWRSPVLPVKWTHHVFISYTLLMNKVNGNKCFVVAASL